MSSSIVISISIDEKTLELFDKIVKQEDLDRSKMLRRWIREHAKELLNV